jgi:hypothetical protein
VSAYQTAETLLALFLTIVFTLSLAVALHDAARDHLLPHLRARLDRARARRHARHPVRPATNARWERPTERRWGAANVAALARGKGDARSGRRSA